MEETDRCGETELRLGCRQPLTYFAVPEACLEMLHDGREVWPDTVFVELERQIHLRK